MSGAVFGRLAGRNAAAWAKERFNRPFTAEGHSLASGSASMTRSRIITLTHVLANRPNVGGPDLDHDALIWSRLRQSPFVLDKG